MNYTKIRKAIWSGLARQGITAEEMCRRAALSKGTFDKHLGSKDSEKMTMREFTKIARVLYLTDEEILSVFK